MGGYTKAPPCPIVSETRTLELIFFNVKVLSLGTKRFHDDPRTQYSSVSCAALSLCTRARLWRLHMILIKSSARKGVWLGHLPQNPDACSD